MEVTLHPYGFTVITNSPSNRGHVGMKCLGVDSKLPKILLG